MPLPASIPGRIAAAVAAALALLLVATQLFLPGIGEGAIEDRLTENGGVAEVSLSATPAARLLWGDGDRLEIAATGLDLPLDTADDPVVFEDLDRFGEVQIVLDASDAGPVSLDSFILARDGDEPYSLEARGETSVADISEFFAESVDLPGSGVLGTILGMIGGGTDLDVDLDMRVASDDGRVRVVEGGGEIAGIPTGPLAELITSAIVVRL